MWRPGRQRDDLERRANAAVRIAEPFRVDLAGPRERLPPEERAAPVRQHVGRTHAAQLTHQMQRRCVGDVDDVAVDHRQGEACALQQASEIAHIGERRDPWAGAALTFGFGFEEGCPSIPGVRELVTRHADIVLRYEDENRQVHEEAFSGMAARIIQHEYDHLEGILFTDKLSGFKKQLLKGKLARISKGDVKHDYRMKFAGEGRRR